jgi:hypothetical protein
MTVKELMELLETCDPDAEVRLGTQESYPFQNSVAGVIDGDLILNSVDAFDPDGDPALRDTLNDFDGPVDASTVWILEGRQLGYFTKDAWNAVR